LQKAIKGEQVHFVRTNLIVFPQFCRFLLQVLQIHHGSGSVFSDNPHFVFEIILMRII